MEQPVTVTVSQVNTYVRIIIERERKLTNLRVRGEISNVSANYRSGHMYFTIKDEGSVIRAVMWAGEARKLTFKPQDGLKVIVTADVRVYEKMGQYQLVVHAMEPDGVGELYAAYLRLKEKLEKEGLFDPALKRPIPQYPKTVAVITAQTGAVWHDIQNVLSRRYPIATLTLYPSLVQGASAPDALREQLLHANYDACADVIILGRGGGSLEELWAFNDEQLARAIRASRIPVISAVGHETDFSISDFVADLRAPTPSAAAELCAVNAFDVLRHAHTRVGTLGARLTQRVGSYAQQLDSLRARRVLAHPHAIVDIRAAALVDLRDRLRRAATGVVDRHEQQLLLALSRVEALSPLSVLRRGYAVARKGDAVVRSVADVRKGDDIEVLISDGRLGATVTGKKKNRAVAGS